MVSSIADKSPQTPGAETRIVGIGASAGGLAAFEQFLEHVPPHSGLAFVVVQHLDPTQKAMLAELLQRTTEMPVQEATDGAPVKPDHVYVIPPNSELSVHNGRLRLQTPGEPRGMRLPVNVLFSSLAGAQGDRAIAVVLSGMGSDGMLGMQAVKAVGGLTVVQRPETAQFDSMPRSAIEAGCADIVGAPDELAARILSYIDEVPDRAALPAGGTSTTFESPPLQDIFALLQERTRHDFSRFTRQHAAPPDSASHGDSQGGHTETVPGSTAEQFSGDRPAVQ
ncbi:MAG: chemotaxis protein CheB [Gammaproteobacteria bacterium]|nr:chemotaxis protein CheB [Gammaproteobacteria bacterium]